MNRDFIGALLQLNAEKGVPQEILIRTLEQAIESAYRRNADAPENVVVTVNPETGEISVAREYEVMATPEEVEDPEAQMIVQEAQKIDPTTGVASLGGKNGLTAVRLAGLKDSAGAPTTGMWATGDVVLDSAGGWHLCSAGGSPGTWT